jgi:hypothetical protein
LRGVAGRGGFLRYNWEGTQQTCGGQNGDAGFQDETMRCLGHGGPGYCMFHKSPVLSVFIECCMKAALVEQILWAGEKTNQSIFSGFRYRKKYQVIETLPP